MRRQALSPTTLAMAPAIFSSIALTWKLRQVSWQVFIILGRGHGLFHRRFRARYAIVLLTATCNFATADSISAFSDTSLSQLKGGSPVHLYSTRLTSFSYPCCSPFTADTKPHKQPVHLFLPLEPQPPQHGSSFFEQTIDVITYLFRHLVLYKPPRKK